MEKSIRKLIVSGAVFGALVVSTSAQALCTQSGQIVERFLAYDYGASYVYFRPRTALTNSTYYYCYIRSSDPGADRMASAAASSKANRVEVNVRGEATTCPTSGTARFMGDCDYIYMLN